LELFLLDLRVKDDRIGIKSNLGKFLKGIRMANMFIKKMLCAKQWLLLILLSALMAPLMGCATIMTGKYQAIPVTSEPPGATVRADTGETILTPGKFHLIRNEDHTLLAEYPGYKPQQLKLHNKAQGWVWGNIIFGGVVGLVVDCVSGSSDELIPKEVHFNFMNPQLTTYEAVKANKEGEKAGEKGTPDEESQAQKTEKETEAPKESGDSIAVSKDRYEEYQQYLAEKEKNKLQESTPEND
jgi:hypothetical protein